MLDAQRLWYTSCLQTGLWFRRNTTDCQEMEQQKHDNNFSQKNALHSQFLDCFSLLLRARDRFTCRSAMLSPRWLVEKGVSRELSDSILIQFENHYKMLLILTLGLILLVLAGAGRIHANDNTKRTSATYDQSEAVKRSKQKCCNQPRQNQYLV